MKTASLIVGLTPRRGRVLTDFNRQDERRDRFLRKKKFKKISSSSKLKDTRRKEPTINLYEEFADELVLNDVTPRRMGQSI